MKQQKKKEREKNGNSRRKTVIYLARHVGYWCLKGGRAPARTSLPLRFWDMLSAF